MKKKSKARSISIIYGVVIKAPIQGKIARGKTMATMTIHQAESDKHSPYPLKIALFDINVPELMTCQKGNKVTVTGRCEYCYK